MLKNNKLKLSYLYIGTFCAHDIWQTSKSFMSIYFYLLFLISKVQIVILDKDSRLKVV